MIFALPFGAGVLLGVCLLPAALPWAALAALVLGWGTAALLKPRRRQIRTGTAGLVCGLLWLALYSFWVLAPAENLVGTEDRVTVELLDYAEASDYGARAEVRVLDRGLRGRAVYYGDRALLDLEPGDRLTADVKYYSARLLSGEASAYYTGKGVFLRLYGKNPLVEEETNAGSLRYLPQRLSLNLRRAVEKVYGGQRAAFITAMLTGDREKLDQQSLSDLKESGLMHVTAVSGLHCGFLAALLGLLLFRRQRLTALVGYPILLFYMLAVGCTPSVVRSCVMMGFLLLAPLAGRENDPPTALSGALLVILLANPYAAGSVSLQLSFAAVAGLLLVTPRVYRAMGKCLRPGSKLGQRGWRFLTGTLSASLGAMIFTAPLGAIYFQTLSMASPLANLLVLWAMPVIFGGALLLTPLAAAFPALLPLTALPDALAGYVLWMAGALAKLPGHAVHFTGPLLAAWLILCYGMLALCAAARSRARTYALAAVLAAVCLLGARSLPGLQVKNDALTIVAVDVGQGAATLLHSGGVTALVDCGSLGSAAGPGDAVANAMEHYGWERLDFVALTHYHQDHAGGLEALFARVEAGRLILPQLGESEQSALQEAVLTLAERYGTAVEFAGEPLTEGLGRAVLRVYPPLAGGEVNEEGLTFLCTAGEFDMLITGDMASSTERLLIETYELPDIEVLAVGHHGSKNSTSVELLEAVAPEVGVVSVGENNSYGHPAAESLARLREAGADIYRTDRQGNILIRVH